MKGIPGGGGGSNGGGGSDNGANNGGDDHSKAQQLLTEHLPYVRDQPHLATIIFTISVALQFLISFFTKHVSNTSWGLGAIPGAGNAKMITPWSLTQEDHCPVGERLRNRSLQNKKDELDYRRAYNAAAAERAPLKRT